MEILLIDDQPQFAKKLQGFLESKGHQTHYFQSGLEVLNLSDEKLSAFEMTVIDRQMPDCDGLEIGQALKKRLPHLVTVMLTADDSSNTIIRALRDSKFDDYLSKRELVKDLVSGQHYLDETLYRAESLLATHKKLKETEAALQREAQLSEALRKQTVNVSKGMVGESKAMRTLRRLIKKVAPTDATVLIRGETGTGKELVAREVHKHSVRSQAPFVAINCAAIPRELLESELFGHEKGAFTGANNSREGFVKMADGGTLFLDEIGDMPLELQAKLLRVLQEKEMIPVGGRQPVKVDVRIISATHQDLKLKVQNKEFREDLFYRLNVFPIQVPPLRDRLEDLEVLINHFISRKGAEVKGISSDALEMLIIRPWSGNIRELENVVERALIVATGATLYPEDFLEDAHRMPQSTESTGPIEISPQKEKIHSISHNNETLWENFEANGFKLWRLVNELSLREHLKEIFKEAVYEKRGRFAVLLMKEPMELPIELQYIHCSTHQLEEIKINFQLFSDYDDKPSASGVQKIRKVPAPGAVVNQQVLKGLPDTYIFDILYPKVKRIAWDQLPPRMLIRATILRYAQVHAYQKSLKTILGEILTVMVDESLASQLSGVRQDGIEAMRAYLSSPSHIFAGIPTQLRVNPEFIEKEIQKAYPGYSRPSHTYEY